MSPESTPRVLDHQGTLVVVDKPSGWVVHGTAEDAGPDVRAWLAESGFEDYSPVHRLDLAASGVVLYSANPDERAALSQWFTGGEVRKRYVALAHRRTHRKGIIRAPLDGRPSVTRYRMLRPLGGFSYLAVRPETGRKHQIRRHLYGIGHPIVGDERYRQTPFRAVPGFPGRLFLHASALALPDGRRWTSELPPELDACLQALEAGSS